MPTPGRLISLLLLARSCSAALRLDICSNSALVPPAQRTLLVDAAAVSLPAGAFLSAELTGTFSPPLAAGAVFDFSCAPAENVARLFVWVDDHLVCQFGAFNNSANGMTDASNFTLRSRLALPLRAHVYPAPGGAGNASFALQWFVHGGGGGGGGGGGFVPLPAASLDAALPAPELARRALQQRAASGWGSWLHRDILSVVLLPDSACIAVQLCHLPTGICLEGTQIDGNGAQGNLPVRVGAHAVDHSYSQAFVSFLFLNVSIEYAVSGGTGLDLTVTPQPGSVDVEQYAVVFAGRFAWGRVGTFTALPGGLAFNGAGLASVALSVTAPPLPASSLPEIHAQGEPYLFPCDADRECASEQCSCNEASCIGLCSKETPLVYYAASFPSGGAVGLSTTVGAGLGAVEARVAAGAASAAASFARFGAALASTTEAVSSALGWSNIFVPTEYGPMVTTSFGFTWIAPAPTSYDFAYVTFDWDNILMSLEASVLGARDTATSSLIQVIKSKHNDGFVPNWFVSRPLVCGRLRSSHSH